MATAQGASGRPTLRQVAELSGVSVKTASRVLNGERYVSAATAEKVLAAASELGFRPNAIARDLRAGARSSTVGLIIGDVANPFYARIARGAERRLRAAGLQLMTASTDEDPELEHVLIADMLERRVRALLIVTSGSEHAYLEAERSHGVPMVFLDRPPDGLQADAVLLDNAGGVRVAVEHLLDRKHQRIGLVGDLDRLPTYQERLAGFEATMTAAGIVDWRRYVRSNAHDVDAAEHAVRELLALRPAPTALLTANNRITVGALRALQGVEVPPAVVGFDDFDLADLLGVTVVAHDAERMGESGAELALGRLGGDRAEARQVVLPTWLVARGSGERSAARRRGR